MGVGKLNRLKAPLKKVRVILKNLSLGLKKRSKTLFKGEERTKYAYLVSISVIIVIITLIVLKDI